MYIHTHAHTHTHTYIYLYAFKYIYAYIQLYICTYIYIYVYVYIYTRMHVVVHISRRWLVNRMTHMVRREERESARLERVQAARMLTDARCVAAKWLPICVSLPSALPSLPSAPYMSISSPQIYACFSAMQRVRLCRGNACTRPWVLILSDVRSAGRRCCLCIAEICDCLSFTTLGNTSGDLREALYVYGDWSCCN